MGLTVRELLRADAYRYCGRSDWRAILEAYLRHPGFRFTYYLRKVSFYSRRKRSLGIFPYVYHRLWLHRYRFRYGFDISLWRHDWPLLKQMRDEFIGRINGIYEMNLGKRQIELLRGHARLLSAQSIQVGAAFMYGRTPMLRAAASNFTSENMSSSVVTPKASACFNASDQACVCASISPGNSA